MDSPHQCVDMSLATAFSVRDRSSLLLINDYCLVA